jgi:hypothetical protein
MPTVTQIRQGIADRLATIPDLNASASAPGQITPPAAVVFPRPTNFVNYATSQAGGTNDYFFLVTLFVSRVDGTSGQDVLDPYVDPTGATSVYAAVAGSLGGIVDDAYVAGIGRYGPFNYAGQDYLGCEFLISVMA